MCLQIVISFYKLKLHDPDNLGKHLLPLVVTISCLNNSSYQWLIL